MKLPNVPDEAKDTRSVLSGVKQVLESIGFKVVIEKATQKNARIAIVTPDGRGHVFETSRVHNPVLPDEPEGDFESIEDIVLYIADALNSVFGGDYFFDCKPDSLAIPYRKSNLQSWKMPVLKFPISLLEPGS